MGTDISPGLLLTDGTLVHDADFNTMVGDSTILATAISAKTLKTEMSLGDEFLINDSGILKKVTGQQVVAITTLPAGCVMDYAGTTEPLGWMFCFGQEISRTTYAALFEAIGTTYGAGDGSTSFLIPDCRGRTRAGDDNMGGTAANRITNAVSGFDGSALGAAGGSESHTLVAAETPVTVPAHSHTVPSHAHTGTFENHYHDMQNHAHYGTGNPIGGAWHLGFGGDTASQGRPMVDANAWTSGPNVGTTSYAYGGHNVYIDGSGVLTSSEAAAIATGGTAHKNVQPTIIMNTIIKT